MRQGLDLIRIEFDLVPHDVVMRRTCRALQTTMGLEEEVEVENGGD
jgi:hypothetical protein